MKTVALLGVGLMGGSIGLAIRDRNIPLRIQAYARRSETRAAALASGIADAVFDDPAEAVRDGCRHLHTPSVFVAPPRTDFDAWLATGEPLVPRELKTTGRNPALLAEATRCCT